MAVALVGALGVLVTAAAPAGAALAPIRGVNVDHADPAIIRADRFYAYGTSTRAPGTRTTWKVPVRSSIDLDLWTDLGDALAQPGAWTDRTTPFWAPAVARIDDRFVLYYSARTAGSNRNFCIGRATSTSPAGPFVDESAEPLVCPSGTGEYEAIDPMVFRDVDGTRYLYWKTTASSVTRLWTAQLQYDGLALAMSPRSILSATEPWEAGIVENPEMVGVDGRYWLLYAAGYWRGDDYSTGVARCDGPAGPCRKVGVWLTSSDAVSGPGGLSLVQDGSGSWWAAYHGWMGRYRAMYIAAVSFGPDGPTLAPERRSPLLALPEGSLDVVAPANGAIRIAGWAFDPDTPAAIGVMVTVDGQLAAMLVAGTARSDLAARFARAGPGHGFDDTVRAGPGSHVVCVSARNNGPGAHTELGCRTVMVAGAPVAA
ncbi:MAG TPA: glycoside hydrolase family 43 protein [Acidimicrobiales bacterium]|nr:glycoside hydrolase family 43 protein [Acidimicrobiales bacterium]